MAHNKAPMDRTMLRPRKISAQRAFSEAPGWPFAGATSRMTQYINAPTINPGIATIQKTQRHEGTMDMSWVARMGPMPSPKSANVHC